MVAIEKFYDDVCTPTVEIRQDGRALLKFVTNHGPIALLLAADTPLLLCERIERVLARSGRATGMHFAGDPPFDLPAAHSAEAQAVDESVELTLRVMVSGKIPSPAPVRVRMTSAVARHLADQTVAAATKAEIEGPKTKTDADLFPK